jgi:hypothetical protein
MKKIFLLPFFAIPLMAMECAYQSFEYVADIKFDKTYVVNQTAPFDEETEVTREEVLGDFNLPENATVKKVTIESISARVVPQAGNAASIVMLSGNITLGGLKPEIFSNYPVPLIGVDEPLIGLNSLIEDGIGKLKTKLEKYLTGTDNSPFTMSVKGNSTPTGGQTIKATVTIRIKGSIVYDVCEEMPRALIDPGEECL